MFFVGNGRGETNIHPHETTRDEQRTAQEILQTEGGGGDVSTAQQSRNNVDETQNRGNTTRRQPHGGGVKRLKNRGNAGGDVGRGKGRRTGPAEKKDPTEKSLVSEWLRAFSRGKIKMRKQNPAAFQVDRPLMGGKDGRKNRVCRPREPANRIGSS